MSQDNVESFERAIEAYNRRDVEALLRELSPEVEWHPALEVLLGGEATTYRGHEGIRDLVRSTDESVREIYVEFPDIRDLGNRIVALGSLRIRGRKSGAETASPVGSVSDYKDGKATLIRTFLDPREALEAAGLRE